MKGQTPIFATAAAVTIVLVMVLIGSYIYSTIANIYPHDQAITNETMCTDSCTPRTLIAFDNQPVLNDSAMICYNGTDDTAALLINGDVSNTSLGYNIVTSSLNLTQNGGAASNYADVLCSYTFDEANANEQSFFNISIDNTSAGFVLLSIAGIVLAAVAIIMIIVLLR